MSFIIPSQKGNFLNAKLAVEKNLNGKIAVIKGEGEIKQLTSPEGRIKSVWNIPVEIEGMSILFTPNSTNIEIMTAAWGSDRVIDGKKQRGIEQKDIIGKTFKVNIVKVKFRGQIVDGIQIEPLKASSVKDEAVETIKVM